ncbi:photosystem I reaction center subunit XI [Gloeobacter violaceus]|uniref:Photosystem I reaction center subunit XI n=1 Tax=Gloeobacter violaceus (strain ATCC 29082 / PCC 7421) TaxID=251221 RepID=PSAL_GLOVI|nr:photosystem I reaction center subunit XI [Gloeobacter violaceus]Q7NIE7.1 RecName: Full=Photosystem I reaction center subunit XI; AltName: Full=PSI subunit V; AltName: Full=PSI-L [Gloeobacter violaceus PCC 7421]7F4V_aL Chain aL, Photosystem I reaction center subunit XI [Gloeobacter violaceus PCC 7421]7F4V_bL Chain bL, Photosystem I reaction center subunit XI [Gloeobacter violaceus PCC 7421]7F4V_cL Chain cL, Photosystem I reaction center subunit XI [Gloeobacter violaceus PCC 7421]BAC90177.1 p
MTLARYVYTPDPQEGTLLTPVNNSTAIRWFIDNLPINRVGMDEFTRGLEIGMAHGYWLIGPFALLGPLRNTELGLVAGLVSTIGLLLISTIGLSGYASLVEDVPTEFDRKGWSRLAGGFLVGGVGGAIFAFAILQFFPLVSAIARIP